MLPEEIIKQLQKNDELEKARSEGFKAGFEEAKRCAADIAEMEADYYANTKYKSDVLRNAVASHIKDLIKGLKYDLSYGEQELIKGIK